MTFAGLGGKPGPAKCRPLPGPPTKKKLLPYPLKIPGRKAEKTKSPGRMPGRNIYNPLDPLKPMLQ